MVIPTIHSGTPFGRPLRYRIQAMEMNVTKKNTAIGLVRRGRPKAFLARQVPTSGRRRMVAKTDALSECPLQVRSNGLPADC